MLRESSKTEGKEVQLGDITGGLTSRTMVDHGDLLLQLTESIVARDVNEIKKARDEVFRVLGNDALIDAVATASAFHGFVRIADAIGIPYTTAAGGQDAAEIREEVGINQFYRVKQSA